MGNLSTLSNRSTWCQVISKLQKSPKLVETTLDGGTWQVIVILAKTVMQTDTYIQPAPITWTKYKNWWCLLNFHIVYCEISWELSNKWLKIKIKEANLN
jgi:hypothetical protein